MELRGCIIQTLFSGIDVRSSQMGFLETDHIHVLGEPEFEGCMDLVLAFDCDGPKAAHIVAANTQAKSQPTGWRIGRIRH